jgi:hypothetical protein
LVVLADDGVYVRGVGRWNLVAIVMASEISKEAVEAAAREIRHRYGIRGDYAVIDHWARDAGAVAFQAAGINEANGWIEKTQAENAITAALPFLCPAPSQSDESLLRQAYSRSLSCDEVNDELWDGVVKRGAVEELSIKHLLTALAVARAEVIAAMREYGAPYPDNTNPECDYPDCACPEDKTDLCRNSPPRPDPAEAMRAKIEALRLELPSNDYERGRNAGLELARAALKGKGEG